MHLYNFKFRKSYFIILLKIKPRIQGLVTSGLLERDEISKRQKSFSFPMISFGMKFSFNIEFSYFYTF